MNPTKLTVSTRRLHADMMTPVTLYLSLRDHYTDPVLLESNESRENEHYYSFIGLETLGSFVVDSGTIRQNFPGGRATEEQTVSGTADVTDSLAAYLHHYQLEGELPANFPFSNGLIGHANYESVQYFDTLEYDPARRPDRTPDLRYHLYRFIIAVHHFRDTLYILENRPAGEPSRLDEIEHHIWARQFAVHPFHITGEETSTMTDAAYRDLVSKGKHHCRRGDVFQIVLSRRFRQGFRGDEFQVYRALRSINPSPYLFFFDYGDYRIFGSSPEAQLVVRDGRARLNPIAGTYRRTGHAAADAAAARALLADPKENAEHIMLVDLARNDLSRHTANVRVTELKDIHYYSHVIHIVSAVEGELPADSNAVRIFGDTFPAGTLSGAPKYRALQLIRDYEPQGRGFYGGAIGFLDFNGNLNQAILIRSFLSQDGRLNYQAGAGVVAASVEENELQEVYNKLGALKKALAAAEGLDG